jgi:hypothetical protein
LVVGKNPIEEELIVVDKNLKIENRVEEVGINGLYVDLTIISQNPLSNIVVCSNI